MKILLIFFGIISTSVFAAVPEANLNVPSLEISLHHHKSMFHRLLEMGFHPSAIGSLMSGKRKPKPPPKPPSDIYNDTVQLFKILDLEFYGTILLGHPGQSFNVSFDTVWGDSFVPSSRCAPTDPACQKQNQYDDGRSSTAVINGTHFSVPFGSDTIDGFYSMDLLHLGHINVTNQTFVQATHLPEFFLPFKPDGIFGMAFVGATVDKTTKPFFYNIMDQFPNMPKLFSFYLNRDSLTTKGGSLILGAVDKKHYNNSVGIKYFPVIDGSNLWKVQMKSVYFDHPRKLTLCEKSCSVIFDTANSVIEVPEKDLDALNYQIKAYPLNGTHRFEVNCQDKLKKPKITFVFGDSKFSLKGKEYIQEVNIGPTRYCYTAFVKSGSDSWALGGAFLYRHYSVFNFANKTVGLAPAIL